ncbi:hypothetical protein EX30DRAFT_195598 [Ascodesmis nigricans]|uniref:AHC1-like C2H2 zinc-finger domain-containing protein n=1 Tax=Ascodesmis nigricans TaxID=341454 RepID=A0A4S2MKT7_9PEZI|nr:hypothetical protein EX30DRAFT_195598 [Ascodesmis nigricans]
MASASSASFPPSPFHSPPNHHRSPMLAAKHPIAEHLNPHARAPYATHDAMDVDPDPPPPPPALTPSSTNLSNSSFAAPTGSSDASRPPPSLESIRAHISEQFDIEILLKHREMRMIEQEIAKTQISLEQLRRCSLLPYTQSPEAQLDAQGNGLIPPAPGVVDGPYTRHYRQWLIPHPALDGNLVEPFAPPPNIQQQQQQQQLGFGFGMGMNGRPQRQSAMKVQTKTGEQVCLYRKRDGTLVKLECGTCHRSNFSSAQGFINHCRIAHQTEYSSHDAAAEACGKPVDEADEALMTPLNVRNPIDGPARHTRQQLSPSWATPLPPRRASTAAKSQKLQQQQQQQQEQKYLPQETPYVSPYILHNNPTPGTFGTPTPAVSSKASHRKSQSYSAGSTRRPSSQTPSSAPKPGLPQHQQQQHQQPHHQHQHQRPMTPPLDFGTTNLQSFLQHKKLNIDVDKLAKDLTTRIPDDASPVSATNINNKRPRSAGLSTHRDPALSAADMGLSLATPPPQMAPTANMGLAAHHHQHHGHHGHGHGHHGSVGNGLRTEFDDDIEMTDYLNLSDSGGSEGWRSEDEEVGAARKKGKMKNVRFAVGGGA